MTGKIEWMNYRFRVLASLGCSLVLVSLAQAQPRPVGGVRPPIVKPITIPKPPTFQPPVMPRPPTFPEIQKPNWPQQPTMPPIVMPPRHNILNNNTTEWFCTRCNHTLSRGPLEPVHITVCPACNARFTNGAGNNFTPITPPPINNPPAPVVNPDGEFNPGNPPMPRAPLVQADNEFIGSATFWIVAAAVVFAVIVLAVMAVIGYFLLSSSNAPTTRRRRSRR